MGRDWSFEYKKRNMRTKRLGADIERSKALELIEHLKRNNITYVNWLTAQIEQELGRDKQE